MIYKRPEEFATISFFHKERESNANNKIILFIVTCCCRMLNDEICTPGCAGDKSVDDVPAIREALNICGNGGRIIISVNKTFMIRPPFDCVVKISELHT